MVRKIVSQEQLLALLNNELHAHAECSQCRFTSVQKLADIDNIGCNWSHANLNCSGQPTAICRPVAEQVLAKAKEAYNVQK